jgi:hypothetical protein
VPVVDRVTRALDGRNAREWFDDGADGGNVGEDDEELEPHDEL